MTREEAIDCLKGLKIYLKTEHIDQEAIDMAIEALSQPIVCKDYRIDDDYIYCSPKMAERVVEALSANYTTKKPNDVIDPKNDVIDRPPTAPTIEKCGNTHYSKPSVEWKLASKELPQSVGSYIVTCKDKHGSVYVDYDFWTVADEFKYNGSKVTAWIPFPKPYREDGKV